MTNNDDSAAIDGAALGRAILAEVWASAQAHSAGVTIAAPDARPEIDASTQVAATSGLVWVAGQMQRWRERARAAAKSGHGEWQSAEEVVGALVYGVQPAIRHLAQSLVALLEAANTATAADDAALRAAAARTEALLALWDEVRADLRARRFPCSQWSGESAFHGILRRLDARLDAVFATVIDLMADPLKAALRHADASGIVTLSVSFDCQSEVRRFTDWARWHWQPRSGCDWTWLLLAFAAGWWVGHD